MPLPRWPIRATLRIRSAGLCAIADAIYATACVRSRRLAPEARAEREHGLGVELRDPRLGDAEHLADLAQGQVLVVVEGDHEALALGQRLDRVGEAVLELGCLRLGLAGRPRWGRWIVSRTEIWPPPPSGSANVQRSSSASTEEFAISSSASWNSSTVISSFAGHLLVGRRALPSSASSCGVGPLDVARPRAHRARHPVERAQLVDDRALDAGDREGLELDLALEVEALDRADQARAGRRR